MLDSALKVWKSVSSVLKLSVGDLVYHLLYGREWVAIVLDLHDAALLCLDRPHKTFCREYVIVHMQKGSKYENFFSGFTQNTKISNSSGYISYHWLRSV